MQEQIRIPGIGLGPVGLKDILRSIWNGRKSVLLAMAIGFAIATIYLHFVHYKYTAQLTVISTRSQDGLSQKMGNLASLAGVSLGSGPNASPFAVYSAIILGRAVADKMSSNPEIMHKVFDKEWDEERQAWRKHDGVLDDVVAGVKEILGVRTGPRTPPGATELYDYIQDNVDITQDLKKPTLVLQFSHKDPVFAAYFLKTLHQTTDDLLRQSNLSQASIYAAYLEDKLKTEQQNELRQVLMENLNQQETVLMMGSSSTPFAAQPIGEAESTARPTSPKPLSVLLIGIALGALVGAFMTINGITFTRLVEALRGESGSRQSRRDYYA